MYLYCNSHSIIRLNYRNLVLIKPFDFSGYIDTHAVPDAYYIVYVDSSRKLTEVKVTKGTYDYFCRFRIK